MKIYRLCIPAAIACWLAASLCTASSFTPLDWRTSLPVVPEMVPDGPFEVAVGFNRCFQPEELGPLRDYLVVRSELVSAAVFRFGSAAELNQVFLHSFTPGIQAKRSATLHPARFQFGPLILGHGTSVSAHEARDSDYYGNGHAHEACILGEDVGIAIVDSGITSDHLQLDDTGESEQRWIAGYDALEKQAIDPQPVISHGSAVAGIVLGKDLRNVLHKCRTFGCRGMAPRADLMDIKVTDSKYLQLSHLTDGFGWLARFHEAHQTPAVANLSFFSCADDEHGTEILAREADALVDLGISVVTAHGNASGCEKPSRCDSACTELTGSPGSAAKVITVAGTDDGGRVNRAYHRPFCDGLCGRDDGRYKPDLSASAELVMAPTSMHGSKDHYHRRSGTSIAAAHVSGAVALIKDVRPHMPPASIKQALIDTTDRQHNPRNQHDPTKRDWDPALGWGILNLDWLPELAATPPSELASLTFVGCKEAAEDGPLADCEPADGSPSWLNQAGIQIETEGSERSATVQVRNHGPKGVSALVRLEGYERAIGNRHYYHLEDRTVYVEGGGSVEVDFDLPEWYDDLQHFRASIHSAWDRSYQDNRTTLNLPDPGSEITFLLDSPYLTGETLLELRYRGGCEVAGAPDRKVLIQPGECPKTWTLGRNGAAECDLEVKAISREHGTVDLGGIRLAPLPAG